HPLFYHRGAKADIAVGPSRAKRRHYRALMVQVRSSQLTISVTDISWPHEQVETATAANTRRVPHSARLVRQGAPRLRHHAAGQGGLAGRGQNGSGKKGLHRKKGCYTGYTPAKSNAWPAKAASKVPLGYRLLKLQSGAAQPCQTHLATLPTVR